MWTTPLVAALSAAVTVAFWTSTPAAPDFHDLQLTTLDRLYHLEGLEVLREDGAREDVVFEDALKLLDVLGVEEMGERGSRKLSKGLVGGGEDSEGASARKGRRELTGGKGGDEGGEIRDRLGELDDVLARARGEGGSRSKAGSIRDQSEDKETDHVVSVMPTVMITSAGELTEVT